MAAPAHVKPKLPRVPLPRQRGGAHRTRKREPFRKRKHKNLEYDAAKLRAYKQARVFEPSAEAYHAAMSVYSAAFGKPDGEVTVVLPGGVELQGWELDGSLARGKGGPDG